MDQVESLPAPRQRAPAQRLVIPGTSWHVGGLVNIKVRVLGTFRTRISYSSELPLGSSDTGKALRNSDNDLIGPEIRGCNLSHSKLNHTQRPCSVSAG